MHHFAADSQKMSGNYFRFWLISVRSLELCTVAARAAERSAESSAVAWSH